ncbi:hypothetical protein RND81_03G065800 [Saponaria officinalis]|uniref:Vacuolar iron transporter n=1 Tax=Saponaria officinalis TaxID=3572 RepID=A0AAW1M497_SAPOF
MDDKQTFPSTIDLVIIHPTSTTTTNVEARLELGQQQPIKPPNHRRLRTAALTVNDGVTCTSCLMIGVGAMTLGHVTLAMIITGVIGLIVGATCMAFGEFISRHHYNLDFEVAGDVAVVLEEGEVVEEEVFSADPLVAAAVTAVAFAVGAVVPLVVVVAVREYNLGLGVVEGATSTVLAVVGWLGPFFGRAPALRAALRVLLCGWLAMAITFGCMIVLIGN